MIVEKRIRIGKSDSVKAQNKKNFLDIDIRQHTKLLPFPDVYETVDQFKIFEDERRACNKYRLILTVKPYCTNILFNTATEIIKNEGDEQEMTWIDDTETDNKPYSFTAESDDVVLGKDTKVLRNEMVKNTEYSNLKYLTYHCGYDIFNNHLLRNKSFKMVNQPPSQGGSNFNKDDFNTISDLMRYANGTNARHISRNSIDTPSLKYKKHLYIYDDIYELSDCINAKLTEENGWYGFTNNSTVESKKLNDDEEWEDMRISRVINSEDFGNCDFIDMYPDRTLFSFNPKYNALQHREEYNWDVCLTYPFRNWYENLLVKNIDCGGDVNAILVEECQKELNQIGEDVVLFKTFFKHNLAKGDAVKIYYRNVDENEYTTFDDYFEVSNIGDINGDNEDVYFYLRNMKKLMDVIEDNNKKEYRIARVVNGNESTYYFRIFRKIPNLRKKQQELTSEIVNDKTVDENMKTPYENYVDINARVSGVNSEMLPFTRETYPLAFSNTIYGDGCTQMTFTDGIELYNLVDNLGRPLTDIYVTILKANRGYEEFYKHNTNNKNIEYSHCFGKLTAGLVFKHKENLNEGDRETYARYGDVQMLNDLDCYNPIPLQMEPVENHSEAENITINDDEFFGDLVEHNVYEAKETVLSDVCFRFNTAQRELNGINLPFKFKYQEIVSDDFDLYGFSVEDYDTDDINQERAAMGGVVLSTIQRPEGYYYKPHYKIQVKELGKINQDSHIEIRVLGAKPVQQDNMYIQLLTSIPHGLAAGEKLFVHDMDNDVMYDTYVVSVINKFNILINPISEMNWFRMCNILNDTNNETIKIRKCNTKIPSYASKIEGNAYIWRDIVQVGDKEAVNLIEYPFTNGYFYIEKDINFFLRRQDPFNENGLYSDDVFPNDIFGYPAKISDNFYKEEEESKSC